MGSGDYVSDTIHPIYGVPSYRRRVLEVGARRSSSGFYRLNGRNVTVWGGTAADGTVEETYSLYHPNWKWRIHTLHSRNVGGPFFNRKIKLRTNCSDLSLASNSDLSRPTLYRHLGVVYPTIAYQRLASAINNGVGYSDTDIWKLDSGMNRNDLREEGVQMMLAANPSNPAYRSADALAELFADKSLMGIPLSDFLKRGSPGMAGEYLNLQFAILPTISDVKTIADITKRSETIMSQYLREIDTWTSRVRRKPTICTTESSVIDNGTLICADGTPLPAYLRNAGRLTITKKITRDIWFEGVYENIMTQKAKSFSAKLAAWNHVYGFLPTPKTVWEATPFSWLIDYFTNAQEFVQGTFMAGSDGSVLVRGYVMAKSRIVTEYTWSGRVCVAGSWKPIILTWTTEEVIQQRESARPYGLDWTGKELTSKQLSILAALGISVIVR